MPVATAIPSNPLPPHAANVAQRAAGQASAVSAAPSAQQGLHGIAQSAVASGVIPGSPEQRRAEKSQAREDALAEKPGFLTRTMDRISGLGSAFFLYDFGVLMGLGAVTGGIGKGVDKVAGWTKSETIGKVGGWLGRRSEGLKGQRKFLEETNVSEALSKSTEALHGRAATAFGEESMAARGMGAVAQGAEAVQSGLNRGAGWAVGKASTALGSVVRHMGPELDAMSALHAGKAQRRMPKIEAQLQKAEEALATHGAVLGESEHMATIQTRFSELKGLLSGTPDASAAKAAGDALGQIRETAKALADTHKETPALASASKALGSTFGKITRPLNAVTASLEKSASWRTLPESLGKLPETLGKTQLHHGLFAGAIGAATLAEMAHTGYGVKHDFHVLKAMVEAVEGKPASTMHVLVGDISPALQEARHHFFGKHKPEVIAEAVAGVANLAFLKKNAGTLPLLGVMVAPQMGHALADDNSALQMYEAMARIQQAGKDLTPEMYAEFVHSLVQDTKTLDIAKHRPQAREQLFAEYAQHKTPVDQLLRDIHSGAMEKRVSELESQLPAVAPAPAQIQQAQAFRPAVGQHTAKLLQQRHAPAAAASMAAPPQGAEAHPAGVPQTTVSHVASAERVHHAPSHAVGGAGA